MRILPDAASSVPTPAAQFVANTRNAVGNAVEHGVFTGASAAGKAARPFARVAGTIAHGVGRAAGGSVLYGVRALAGVAARSPVSTAIGLAMTPSLVRSAMNSGDSVYQTARNLQKSPVPQRELTSLASANNLFSMEKEIFPTVPESFMRIIPTNEAVEEISKTAGKLEEWARDATAELQLNAIDSLKGTIKHPVDLAASVSAMMSGKPNPAPSFVSELKRYLPMALAIGGTSAAVGGAYAGAKHLATVMEANRERRDMDADFQTLVAKNPEFRETPEKLSKARELYQALYDIAPTVSRNPVLIRDPLRQVLANDDMPGAGAGLGTDLIRSLVDIESKARDLRPRFSEHLPSAGNVAAGGRK